MRDVETEVCVLEKDIRKFRYIEEVLENRK